MPINLRTIGYCLIFTSMWCFGGVCLGEVTEQVLVWQIDASQERLYPGEAVLLTITIENLGNEDEGIFFGSAGLEAFSFEILDANNNVICQGDNIHRYGLGESGILRVGRGMKAQKPIVLNRWCSTLLSPDTYQLNCFIDYSLISEVRNHRIGSAHRVELGLDLEIVDSNETELRLMLDDLADRAFPTSAHGTNTREYMKTARKMICFTESHLAFKHQLQLLRCSGSTQLKRDIIQSLVNSASLEAIEGLIDIVDHASHYGAEDVRRTAITAVYTIREGGKPDVQRVTEEFVRKHPCPQLGKVVD